MTRDDAGQGEYLAAFRAFRSRDLDEVRNYIGDVFKPHALRAFGRARDADTMVNHRATAAGSLVYFGYGNMTVEVDPGPLADFYLLQFACSGSGRMKYGARVVDLDPATSAACLSPQRETHGRFNAGTKMLVARTERGRLEAHYAAHIGHTPDMPLEFDPHIDTHGAGGAHLAAIVRSLGNYSDGAAGPSFAELQSLLLTTLIYVQPNTWREQLLRTPPPAKPKDLRAVQDYMQEFMGEELTIERLAAVACSSTRTLFVSFQRHVGVAPMTYLRNLRLDRARAELSGAMNENVTSIAARCGFTHMGRFAAEYRRKFGESPSETRRRF